MSIQGNLIIFLLTLIQLVFSTQTFAQSEEEKNFLTLYFKEDELQIISTTRSLKSITRVAENVEVVTASDIELMNAHTLAEVMQTINGVQVVAGGPSPGNDAPLLIQGSDMRHVAVFMDGIPLNTLSDSNFNAGGFPVQMIDRIEVIKGPASSAWGSSLGGVVNIITKGPGSEEKLSGTLSASYGERDTGDYRAEAYGKKGALGYYVSAGRIQTDGLKSFSSSSLNNVYTKLTYDVAEKSTMLFNFFYRKTRSGGGEEAENDLFFDDQTEQLYSRLAFHTSLDAHTALNFALWLSRQSSELSIGQFSTMSELQKNSFMERGYGGSADVTWKQGAHTVVAGIDLNSGTLETNTIVGGEQDLKRWAAFANDTIVLDRLTITPGIRFDHSNLFSDFTSPSLGVTYALAEKTLVRAYVARGFSDPTLVSLFGHTLLFTGNPSLGPEKVWSYQGGIETGALKYLWLKVSVFRHDIRDGIVDQTLPDNTFTAVNQNRIRRQGAEAEIRTLPLWNTLLQAGASWISTKNLDTGQDLQDVPHYTYSIAIKYDDEKSFKALLKGYYIWWNEPAVNNAKYSSMIFDLNIIKTFFRQKDRSLDAFLTAHNLFNGSQYFVDIYPNSKRWFEGGLRYKF